jgi:hypothetical protein
MAINRGLVGAMLQTGVRTLVLARLATRAYRRDTQRQQ